MITQVGKKAENLSYILLEMVNKQKVAEKAIKSAKDIDRGLFEGILVHLLEDDSTRAYVVLSTSAKETVLLDLEEYNFLSLELFDGTVKEYLFFRDTHKDQKAAFGEVVDLMAGMADAKRNAKGHDLIDTSTYSELPKNFTDALDIKMVGKATSTGCGSSRSSKTAASTASQSKTYTTHNNTAVNVKMATFFKRKPKVPHGNTLIALAKKIKAIDDGTYDAPELPKTDTTSEVYCAASYGGRSSYEYWD